jgi:hypothetical protein
VCIRIPHGIRIVGRLLTLADRGILGTRRILKEGARVERSELIFLFFLNELDLGRRAILLAVGDRLRRPMGKGKGSRGSRQQTMGLIRNGR